MSKQKFFRCKQCGNLVGLIKDGGVPMICCGEPMEELQPNTVEASTEKHIPVVNVEECTVHTKIGSLPHPMTEEHHIEFIYLQTQKGGQKKCLEIGAEAQASFAVVEDKALEVFAYCNLHGLWKAEIPCDCKETEGKQNPVDETICSAEFTKGCI